MTEETTEDFEEKYSPERCNDIVKAILERKRTERELKTVASRHEDYRQGFFTLTAQELLTIGFINYYVKHELDFVDNDPEEVPCVSYDNKLGEEVEVPACLLPCEKFVDVYYKETRGLLEELAIQENKSVSKSDIIDSLEDTFESLSKHGLIGFAGNGDYFFLTQEGANLCAYLNSEDKTVFQDYAKRVIAGEEAWYEFGKYLKDKQNKLRFQLSKSISDAGN